MKREIAQVFTSLALSISISDLLIDLIGNLVNEVFVQIYSTEKVADWTKSSDKIPGFHYQYKINASNEWRAEKFNLRLPDETLDQEYEKKLFEEMG